MQILDRSIMPNGTAIQLEDWSEHNTAEYPSLYGLQIGAYPIAKNSDDRYHLTQRGRPFRLTIAHNEYKGYTNEMIRADYEALKAGEKTLEDLAEYFWDGKKDMYYLGIIDDYERVY